MKQFIFVAALFILAFYVMDASAQTRSRDYQLDNSSGNRITLSAPSSVTNYSLVWPGTAGATGSLFYINNLTGSTATASYLAPTTNGYVLALAAGLPVWTDVNSLIAVNPNAWAITGNAILAAYNGVVGSFLGSTTAFPLVIATTNIATPQPIEFFTNNAEKMRLTSAGELGIGLTPTSGKLLHVTGTAGTSNVRLASLASATGTTGKVMFADANGDMGALAAPSSTLFLQSTSGGVLSWTAGGSGVTSVGLALPSIFTVSGSPVTTIGTLTGSLATQTANTIFAGPTSGAAAAPTFRTLDTADLSGKAWLRTGNSGTTAGADFIGTTDVKDFVVKTGGNVAANERVRVDAQGQVGIGNIQPAVMLDVKGGFATRSSTLTLANGKNNNVSIGDNSYIRVTGPTAHDTITGIRDGYDGKQISIFNTVNQLMTFAIQNTNSVDTTRIVNLIGQGGDVAIEDSGRVDLRYDGTMARWVITNIVGATSAVNGGFAYFTRVTADQIHTGNTTLEDVTGFNVPMLHDIVHTLDGVFYFTATSNATDCKVAFDVPGTPSLMKITVIGHSDEGANTVEGSDVIQADNTASSTININAGTEMFVLVHGILINGSTTGNMQIRFSQASNTGLLTIKAGSYLRLIPVGSN